MPTLVERMAWSLVRRQIGSGSGGDGDDDGDGEAGGFEGGAYTGDDDGNTDWWWTPAGMATRYAVVAILFGSLLIFLVGSYYHAQRRLQRGLPPLAYHRWMLRRQLYQRYPPRQPYYATYQNPNVQSQPANGYVMEHYPPPPPAYNPAEASPPVYQPPPPVPSKVLADQNFPRRVATPSAQGEANDESGGTGGFVAVPQPAATARP